MKTLCDVCAVYLRYKQYNEIKRKYKKIGVIMTLFFFLYFLVGHLLYTRDEKVYYIIRNRVVDGRTRRGRYRG